MRDAIARVSSSGVEVVLVTGRSPWSGVPELAAQLGLVGPHITMQGALISVPATRAISRLRALLPALYLDALRFADELGLDPVVALIDAHRAERLPDGIDFLAVPPADRRWFRYSTDLARLADKSPIRIFLPTGPARHRSVRIAAHEFFDGRASVVSSDLSGIEILASGTNKGEAVTWLAAARGIDLDEVAAVGDARRVPVVLPGPVGRPSRSQRSRAGHSTAGLRSSGRRRPGPAGRARAGRGTTTGGDRRPPGTLWRHARSPVTYFQAVLLGLLQGVTELFPVSSLGHTVILPKLLGWNDLVAAQSANESFFLAFLVGLHVATALALVVFYWRTWVDIVRGVLVSLRRRRIETSTQRLGWLLVVATIPAGLVGVAFEHPLRTLFAKPLAAAAFLFLNGLVLATAEAFRRRAEVRAIALAHGLNPEGARRLETLEFREAGVVGVAQVFALLAGISRSGITIAAGLVRGLDHEDAARFSFLLATPIILAAGVYKLPDLLGPDGHGVLGQVLLGSAAAAVAAYVSVRFLTRYFTTRTLTPFAIYCLVAGAGLVGWFGLHG